MALPPNPSGDAASHHQQQTFHTFFNSWLVEQNQLLQQLKAAISAPLPDQEQLRSLIARVLEHYKEYNHVKSRWRKLHVFNILAPSWRSSLENAYLWIGGWRPSMAFSLLLSKSGLQLEANLADVIQGNGPNDLSSLSATQLSKLDGVKKWAIDEERKTNEMMAEAQESGADADMVELSSTAGELVNRKRLTRALETKEDKFEKVVERADKLRSKTLKSVLNILEPIQAVHFLIAAAELHLKVHEWGVSRDNTGNPVPPA